MLTLVVTKKADRSAKCRSRGDKMSAERCGQKGVRRQWLAKERKCRQREKIQKHKRQPLKKQSQQQKTPTKHD